MICWKWEDHKTVHTLEWGGYAWGDEEIIRDFYEHAKKADELVAHHGDGFDLRWFNAELLRHRLEPLPEPKTVDTLKIARKHFLLENNKLDYIAQLLFGKNNGKQGKPVLDDWINIAMLQPDDAVYKESMRKMKKYCQHDVRILEQVYKELERFSAVQTHAGVFQGRAKWSCAKCGSEDVQTNKRRVTAKGTPQYTMQCQDCRKYYTISSSDHTRWLDWKATRGDDVD